MFKRKSLPLRRRTGRLTEPPLGLGPFPISPGRGVALAVIEPEATEGQVRQLVEDLRLHQIDASLYDIGTGVIMVSDLAAAELERLGDGSPVIERVLLPQSRYRLVLRELCPLGTLVDIGGVPFGGTDFVVIAGPCAVENRAQLLAAARAVATAGASVLRGGAFKMRTSPHDFQGLGMHGIDMLAEVRRATGLPFFTEVVDPAHIEAMYGAVDGFQVGARNMQNFELLKALGEVDKPVLLKRGPGATVDEWLLSAEYLLVGGNNQVVLCERGIRTFNSHTRYTLDLATVAFAKRETHLPVIVDPSHATGDPALVPPMALAALAAGADGVIIEVHPDPEAALSDGYQAVRPSDFGPLVGQLAAIAPGLGRRLASRPGNRRA